jgi:hypothetical protein
MFSGLSGFYVFSLFLVAPPVYISGTERAASKLLFIFTARAATLLLLRATQSAKPLYSSVFIWPVLL